MTSETEITSLNRRRGNIKGQLTKMANALLEQEDLSIPELQAKLDVVLKLQEKFELLKNDYYKLTNETEYAEAEPGLNSVEDDLQNLEVSLKTSINKFKYDAKPLSMLNNGQPKETQIKLPKIPLPTFNGKFEEWGLFKTQFYGLINENSQLLDSEKLYYLRGALRGDAKVVETSDDDFLSLFKALEQRYENKRVIVDGHIKNILNLQVMKYESSRDLRILLDNIKKNLRSLKILNFERDKLSNALLLNVVLIKLDRETRKQYELTLKDNEVPDFDVCLEFLERRYQILCSINNGITTKSNYERSKSLVIKSNKPKLCSACKTHAHALYHCDKFKAMKLSDRTDLVKKLRVCTNCLSEFHIVSICNSKNNCFVCKKRHHTLLHRYSTPASNFRAELDTLQPDSCTSQVVNCTESDSTSENAHVSFHINGNNKSILINTAIVYVKDSNGIRKPLRAILDCASESSFISSRSADALGLLKEKINISISGLNDASINIKRKISAQISNARNDKQWEIDLLLVPKISNFSPSKRIDVAHLNIPSNIHLADPTFSIPQRVDLLLGAELFFAFLEKDKIEIGNNLFLQSSCFGYLVSGKISNNNLDISTKYCFLGKNLEALNKTLSNFWEIEDVETPTCNREELNYCNEHFAKTHFRKAEGKYVVSMPLKSELPETMLGNSKMIASKRLDQLWTRLEREPTMKALYSDFLNEYECLHHMEEVEEDSNLDAGYYLPHHGILRPDSKTTKLRVVFNASAKTTSGYSLNDLLYKGGVLQEDLFSILIRFRKHIYAFTADIKQMFRMIEINESQTRLQKILWKISKSSPTKVYKLRTVTYGTASAPFLATKVLQQLALDEEKNFPLASRVLLQDFYMDDCLSGSSKLADFETLQLELKQLLQRGGMTLHKWCTNLTRTTVQEEFSLDRNSEEIQVKTLGMIWNSLSDTFTYKANACINRSYTKRDVLSQIARIYDPIGLLGPVISKAKIFMQQLWLLKLDWYEILPQDISQQWGNFIKTLPDLEKIKIPRCFLKPNATSVVLHGFADASSKSYGAVVYLQTMSITEESNCRLLCSKSRVAPTKFMTIPRLELCACLLLSKLAHKVISALKMQIESVRLWSDSTIALAWINTPPNLLKTFVSNRVSQIQQLSKDFQWRHVSSECNPADIISRGLDVKALATNDLWWKGPDLENLSVATPDGLQVSSTVTDQSYTNEIKPISKLTLKLNVDSNFIDNLLDLTNFYKLEF